MSVCNINLIQSQSLLEVEEKLQNAMQSMDFTSRAKRILLKEKVYDLKYHFLRRMLSLQTSLIETVSSLEQQLKHMKEK